MGRWRDPTETAFAAQIEVARPAEGLRLWGLAGPADHRGSGAEGGAKRTAADRKVVDTIIYFQLSENHQYLASPRGNFTAQVQNGCRLEDSFLLIGELVRAANNLEKIDLVVRVRLLRRASAVIRELRRQIGLAPRPADYMPGAIAAQKAGSARMPMIRSDQKVATLLLEAARSIREAENLLQLKRERVGTEKV